MKKCTWCGKLWPDALSQCPDEFEPLVACEPEEMAKNTEQQAEGEKKSLLADIPVKTQPEREVKGDLLVRFFSGPSWICPFCGSDDLKTTSAKTLISLSGDRLCKTCDASWAPPIPKWAAITMLALLVLVIFVLAIIDNYLHGALLRALTIWQLVALCFWVASVYSCIRILLGKSGRLTIHKVGVKKI